VRLYYGGLVVHQSQSDDGVIEVVDTGDMRSLHFGTHPRQSCMSLQTPHSLELSYTEAMMAALLLNPNPQNILIIGLGGGSLVKYLLYHFPQCQIEVVEYREDVVRIAHGYFKVPENEERLKIHIGDGYLYLQDRYYHDDQKYDLVLVDAYDHIGMAASVGVQAFFDACEGILTREGLMSINLWGSNRSAFKQTMSRINQSFAGKSLILPVEDKGNVICFATAQLVTQAQLKKLSSKVDLLEAKFGISLSKALRELTRRNSSFIERLFI
jgi:spermidine synthase